MQSEHTGSNARHRVLALSVFAVLVMLLQPLVSSAETETDASYNVRASILAKKGAWQEHSHVVANWIRRSPDSARAWYHEGLLLRALSRPSAVAAFERAVKLDPSSSIAWQALCVQLYREERLVESVECAENIPLNEMRDEFVAQTFQHPIFVSRVHYSERPRTVQPQGADTVQQEHSRSNSSEPDDLQRRSRARDQVELARSEARELAKLIDLRDRCEALQNAAQSMGEKATTPFGAMAAMPFGTAAFQACGAYDRALKERQYFEAFLRQQQ